MTPKENVTFLLNDWREGDDAAMERSAALGRWHREPHEERAREQTVAVARLVRLRANTLCILPASSNAHRPIRPSMVLREISTGGHASREEVAGIAYV